VWLEAQCDLSFVALTCWARHSIILMMSLPGSHWCEVASLQQGVPPHLGVPGRVVFYVCVCLCSYPAGRCSRLLPVLVRPMTTAIYYRFS